MNNNEIFQNEEMQNISFIYGSDIKILKSSYPFKLRYTIEPLIEKENIIFKFKTFIPYLDILIELGDSYPEEHLSYIIECNDYNVKRSKEFIDFKISMDKVIKASKDIPLINFLIENFRNFLFKFLTQNDKNFVKRRHFMNNEESDEEDINLNRWGVLENLKKKDQTTNFSTESFNKWNENFLMEINKEKILNPEYKQKLVNEKKKTGKQFFLDNKSLLNFVQDDKIEDNDEDFDILKAKKDKVEIDEDIFKIDEEDEDLDDIDFE